MKVHEEKEKLWRCLARALMKKDPALAPLISRIGPPVISLERQPFRALCEAILSQQLATKAAQSIISRFSALSPPFPTPEKVFTYSPQLLRSVGISQQKGAYLLSLARRWEDSTWRRGWGKLSDAQLIERLVEVKGIGEWTAQMFLIFSLGRPNVLPVLDFGVRKGLQLLRKKRELPTPKEVPILAQSWEGAYSVGSWYLWRALDQKILK